MTHRPAVLLAVAVGGAAGAAARQAVAHVVPLGVVPWPTLLVNLSGSFLLGVLVTLAAHERGPHPLARPLLATGALGAFTTYSTFAVETLLLVRDGRAVVAALYAAGSITAGLVVLAAGMVLARKVVASR